MQVLPGKQTPYRTAIKEYLPFAGLRPEVIRSAKSLEVRAVADSTYGVRQVIIPAKTGSPTK
ncbi:hypothetical protein [Nitrobacter sp. JJSN]|uniref:hypothetical protein n=1 Tax=Nitrobacter sp. JJSN TaxID=3453033 RepID=UPI003F76AE53